VSAARVLVVDDSPTVRAVLCRVLSRVGGVEVVGQAGDGREAVEAESRLRPDVVIMDIEMPEVDGFVATERIMAESPTAVIVVSSRVNRDEMRTAFEAIRRGAVGVLPKPETPSDWEEMEQTLAETIRALARTSHRMTTAAPATRRGEKSRLAVPARAATPSAVSAAEVPAEGSLRFLGVGASTGGPGAVRELLEGLGPRLGLGVAVVQHISPGFELGMADWLAAELRLDVRVAREGEPLAPGVVRIAPPDGHLRVDGEGRLELDRSTPPRRGHRPSADELFWSLAAHSPRETAGVLLSGMGDDGALGLAGLREAGGFTAVQDEASCAVFGMPRAALELGAAGLALAPVEIGRLLARAVRDRSGGGGDGR